MQFNYKIVATLKVIIIIKRNKIGVFKKIINLFLNNWLLL